MGQGKPKSGDHKPNHVADNSETTDAQRRLAGVQHLSGEGGSAERQKRQRSQVERRTSPGNTDIANGKIFYTLRETEVLIKAWRRHYNTATPHSALDYRPPAPEAIIARDAALVPCPGAPALQGARSASPAVALPRIMQ